MAANAALKITSTNFPSIKSNLKSFLSAQTEFLDYDFEGSAMAQLLDVLAYNTYYNSVYLNQVANEMYLDSALIRNNVVSRAKMLGYTPTSAQGATAQLLIDINPPGTPDSVTIPANTSFTSTIDGNDYIFVTEQSYNVNAAAGYTATIDIVEGRHFAHEWEVNSTTPERYIIPNKMVDTRSIVVKVIESSSNSAFELYKTANDLTRVGASSPVFFLQENLDGQYEINFGDGVLGKKPSDGNIIQASYRICAGTETNGAAVFTGPDLIGLNPVTGTGFSNYDITVNTAAEGGANVETVSSIKFNAPKNYETQNRAVTANDYKQLILNANPDFQTVRVWGGEENDPPIYGKVYISAKPKIGNELSSARKDALKIWLEERNVMSIDPEFVDPSYVYIVPQVTIRYNPEQTALSAGEISTRLQTAIQDYETDKLGNFGDAFYKSDFMRTLEDKETSIVSVAVDLKIQKRFQPSAELTSTYKLPFNNSISNPHAGHLGAVVSSSFTYNGRSGTYLEDDGNGIINFYYFSTGSTKVVTNEAAGLVDYSSGLITLESILITAISGSDLKVDVKPNLSDIFTVRNQIPLFADSEITIINNVTKKTESIVKEITTTGTTTQINETGVNTVII